MNLAAELVADLAGDMDEKAILNVLNGKVTFAGAKEPEAFLAQMHQEMLWQIDALIDSGRNADGSESPKRRNHVRAPRAWEGACSCFEHWSKLQLLPGDPPRLRLVPRLNRISGALEARTRNSLIIAMVLLSDLRLRLARCRYRNCGRYFLLLHVRETPYANGHFCCTSHSRREAAVKRTRERREKAHALLTECAARELRRQEGKPRVKEKLVAVLNQRIDKDPNLRTRQPVKKNWVTHHFPEIQQKAGSCPKSVKGAERL